MLPVYNERGHLRAEIDRIHRALTASPYSFEIIVVDDGSDDGSEVDLPAIDGHPPDPPRPQPRLGHGPAHRHHGGLGTDRRVDRRRHDVPERRDPDAGQGARRLRPHRRGAAHRGGHASASSGSRPSGSSASSPATSPTPTSPTSTPACGRSGAMSAMQYVHHLPAGFSCVTTLTMSFLVQRLLGQVRADRLLAAGRHVEVPLVARHQALPAAGRADVAVVQPAEGVPADSG